MKVVDEKLLAEFRESPRCEWCNKAKPVEPHHIFSRGAGRLDIRWNLVALCRWCHSSAHSANSVNNARPKLQDLLELVARREGIKPEEIKPRVDRLRRQDKFDHWEVS